jgi:hypothetical protein
MTLELSGQTLDAALRGDELLASIAAWSPTHPGRGLRSSAARVAGRGVPSLGITERHLLLAFCDGRVLRWTSASISGFGCEFTAPVPYGRACCAVTVRLCDGGEVEFRSVDLDGTWRFAAVLRSVLES